jgi:hypothetical protein
MADWTELSNTAVGVGGLPSGATITALRDNPIAIAEGAPNAPPLSLRALGTLVAGDVLRVRNPGEYTWTNSASFGTALGYSFIQFGTVRMSGEYKRNNSTSTFQLTRTRRNVETILQTFTFVNSSYLPWAYDVDVQPADTIKVQVKSGSTGSITYLLNTTISTDGAFDIWPIESNPSASQEFTGNTW